MDKTLSSLVEISKAINSVLEIDRLLETIMDSAIDSIGVERGVLFLKDPDGSLQPRVARNVEKETLANATEISRSITAEVASSGKYVLSSNVQDDPSVMGRDSVKAFKIRSVLCVPLADKETIIGTIYLDSRKVTTTFSPQTVEFLQMFANLAAIAIQNARRYEATQNEARYWKGEASGKYRYENIICVSPPMRAVCERARSVAGTNVSVLITGESGTGKELVARAIHYESPRRERKFVPINCSALPEQILEAELFGARKGAFTGAVADSRGLFEEADGGTIFLDEIADMQPALQAKLLRALQEGEIRRVGDTQYRYVNVRVLSATNRNLADTIRQGAFREDLYYRLCGMEVAIPPLRERPDDIVPLTMSFIGSFCAENGIPAKTPTADAMAALQRYAFPGNVRELQNIVRKAVILASEPSAITDFHLPDGDDALMREELDGVIRQHIVDTLNRVDWNQTRAAEILGLSRTTLQAKMQKLGIAR
jgi:transcriptional regulator with GAF, ATPase, and Fis domain